MAQFPGIGLLEKFLLVHMQTMLLGQGQYNLLELFLTG